jgi:hypothetical protein
VIRVLCDEDLPHKLRMHLPEHDVVTVGYMDWGGLKNGELLKAAEEAGFDVLLTGDQSMPKEQNIAGRNLAIVTLSAIEWPIIKPHVGKIAAAIVTAKPGTVTRVDVGAFVRGRHRTGLHPG